VGRRSAWTRQHHYNLHSNHAVRVIRNILKDGKQQQVDHIVVSKDSSTTHETIKGKDSQGRPFEVLPVFDKQ